MSMVTNHWYYENVRFEESNVLKVVKKYPGIKWWMLSNLMK
jgi:hypothetical protein